MPTTLSLARFMSAPRYLGAQGAPAACRRKVRKVVVEEPADPLSLPSDGTSYLAAARSGWKPKRIAVSRDLGLPPVDREVAELVLAAFIEGIQSDDDPPDTGTLRGDLVALGDMICGHAREHAATMRAVLGELNRIPALHTALQSFLAGRRALSNV